MSLTAYSESSGVRDYQCTEKEYFFEQIFSGEKVLQYWYCFCSQYSFTKLFQEFDEITVNCERIFREQLSNFGINIGITCVIVVLNLIM